MKLSIVIPVYNVVPYLRKCVESVLKQDLDPKEYEVILVDDGSTDGSGELCDELTDRRQATGNRRQAVNITVIHQKNAGLSAARNAGIMVATGEYIQFVDSDDYLEPNVLGGLVRQMEDEKLDVLRFDYKIINEQGGAIWPSKQPKVYDSSHEVTDGETYLDTRFSTQCYVVQFIVKRALVVNYNLYFKEGVYFEDTEWTPRLMWAAKRVNYADVVVYDYLWRTGTISRNKDQEKKLKTIRDLLTIIERHTQNRQQHPNSPWLEIMIQNLTANLLHHIAAYDFFHTKQYVGKLQNLGALRKSSASTYIFVIKTRMKYLIYNFLHR